MAATDDKPESDAGEDRKPAERPKPTKRRRKNRPYPAAGLEDVLTLPTAIVEQAGGTNRVRRLSVLEALGRSADSSASRDLVTNSGKYGLTSGSYGAEFLELTDQGRRAVDPDVAPASQLLARFHLAIENVEPSRVLYERLVNNRLPATSVLRDLLIEAEIDADFADEAVELFIVNAKSLGLLRTIAGAERVVPIEQVIEEHDDEPDRPSQHPEPDPEARHQPPAKRLAAAARTLEDVCFFVTPIGEEGGSTRRHSDFVLAQLVDPAVSSVDASLRVVRADLIAEAGQITQQVLRHIADARLVVADLSFHNPNVFYELALRHAIGKPAVLLSRSIDPIPFDVGDLRVVKFDLEDVYTFVPQLEAYRAEIASHVRQALTSPESVTTPVSGILGKS